MIEAVPSNTALPSMAEFEHNLAKSAINAAITSQQNASKNIPVTAQPINSMLKVALEGMLTCFHDGVVSDIFRGRPAAFDIATMKIAEARIALSVADNSGPTGWKRHPATGRRRPDGDAAREHVCL